ncbi:MAG: hypothetical protein ACREQI_14730 [Candidatus Binataceae bacterium]
MKLVGIIVILFGWFVAVSSVLVGAVIAKLFIATLGFLIALFGIVGVLNPAHNATAIWKQ